MAKSLGERLEEIKVHITKPNFLKNEGIGNEIGFYIFDYDPEDENRIRDYVEFIIKDLKKQKPPVKVLNLNLYDLILDLLKEKNLLEKAFELEKQKGDEFLFKSLSPLLKTENIIAKIQTLLKDESMVFLTGIGSAWPLVRSHTILNQLHSIIKGKPLIAFFPGTYDNKELILFGKFTDNNYYRAFILVKR